MKLIVLFFFTVFHVYAQNKVSKEIEYTSQKIKILLDDVDHILLINNKEGKVIISLEDYKDSQTSLSVKENNNSIIITSSVVKKQQLDKIQKFCVVQPAFPLYIISVPNKVEIEISYKDGNFNATNFNGQLELFLNTGNINISNCIGSVVMELYSGNVSASISNTEIDILSHKGMIRNHIENIKKLRKKNRSLKGVYGNLINTLKVITIQGNIELNSAKTQ